MIAACIILFAGLAAPLVLKSARHRQFQRPGDKHAAPPGLLGDPLIYVHTPDQIEIVSEVSTITGWVKVN